ncbi:serine/threonine protein phosphatase [Thioalkalivibrio sp. HL-Eb18]|uniref:serine/threonine protein phosphatase n=1 Tax=Thioalkalivibrio sp. HL-Eb18 TaxID=1266913 RepID=UPI001E647C04|nr:serine/threonine protein phosphatase [Thioalkalivibrio sp. HL-Eb18]
MHTVPAQSEAPTRTTLDVAAMAARGRAFVVREGSRSWYAKKAVPGRSSIRALGGSLLARLTLGEWAPLAPLRLGGQDQIAYEAERLRALRAAGEAVPEVVCLESGYLVLAESGQPLGHALRRAGFERSAELLTWAARDLARFHARGLWHGGAQVRNHLLADGGKTLMRIDFEEPLDQLMPLPARQAVDLYLLVYSATALKGLPETDLHRLGSRMVCAYLEAHAPDERMLGYLHRGQRVLGALEAGIGWLARAVSKDARRLFTTRAVLAEVLERAGDAPGAISDGQGRCDR